jgi:hypothetical protein
MNSVEVQLADHMKDALAEADLVATFSPHWNNIAIDTTRRLGETNAITVVRTYIPEYALENSDDARITLLQFNQIESRKTRHTMQIDYNIDCMVHRRLSDPSGIGRRPTPKDVSAREEVWHDEVTEYGDAIALLAQRCATVFENPTYHSKVYDMPDGTQGCARWLKVVRDADYQRAMIEEKHVMFSNLRSVWRTYRDLAISG